MLEFKVNFDPLLTAIGAVYGISDAADSSQYMNDVLNSIHSKASQQFDNAAASFATTGRIKHMYEWGTAGINKERTTRRFSDPTSPEARLWVHTSEGEGNIKYIGFDYRLSTVPIPPPTTTKTGVSQEELQKLSDRRYVFYNKAMVMETGMEVEIVGRHSNVLFIPFYGNPSPDASKRDVERGFTLYPWPKKGPIKTRPGKKVAGSFTAFFEGWWKTAGMKSMNQQGDLEFNEDIYIVLDKAEAKGKTERAVRSPKVKTGAVEKQREKTKKEMLARAKKKGVKRS